MDISVEKSSLRGRVTVPMSKSIAHRYLILGAMTEKSEIIGIPRGEDVDRTVDCLYNMGADIVRCGDRITLGGLFRNSPRSRDLYPGESGSTLRFLMPVASILGDFSFHLGERLSDRPYEEYKGLINMEKNGDVVTVKKTKYGNELSVSADRSSQFISGLLLLSAYKGGSVTVEGDRHSGPYIDLTADSIRRFGVDCRENGGTFTVSGTLLNTTARNEGDWSSAAVWFILNEMGANIDISGLTEDTLQGDKAVKDMMSRDEWNVDDTPDLAPYLMVLAAYRGSGKLTGTGRLRYKESRRDTAMSEELRRFGAKVLISDDEITVKCASLKTPNGPLCCHGDHRIAMALAALCTVTGGVIGGAECVDKSYPDFFKDMVSLGVSAEKI